MNIKIILSIIMLIAIAFAPIGLVTASNPYIEDLQCILIDNENSYDILNINTSKIVDKRTYQPQALIEWHLPFIVQFNASEPVTLSKERVKKLLTHEVMDKKGKDKDITFEYNILTNETYFYDIPIYENQSYNYTVYIEPINETEGYNITVEGYHWVIIGNDTIEDYRYVWKEIKNLQGHTFKQQDFYVLDIIARTTAHIGSWSVDIVPTIELFNHKTTLYEWAWWNSNWDYSKSITINSSQVPSTLANFPILIHNISTDYVSHAQFDGEDFVFVDSTNTTQYYHDLDEYNGATGELLAWVNITSLSHTSDTVIWMYYGNSGCSAQEDEDNTWNSNYLGVYHMNDTGNCIDSSGNSNDGTYQGSLPTRIAGKIGYGQYFDGSDYISLPGGTFASVSATISLWQKEDDNDAYHQFYACAETEGSDSVHKLMPYSNDIEWGYMYEGAWVWDNTNDNTRTAEVGFYAHMFDGSSSQLWRNKSVASSEATGTSGKVFTPTLFYVGVNRLLSGNYYLGWMDEFRISDIKRSDHWMLVTYNTSNNPTTFTAFGIEQIPPTITPPTLSTPRPTDSSINCCLPVSLGITVSDNEADTMDIAFYTNLSGIWAVIGSANHTDVSNGTYYKISYDFELYATTYYWSANVTDGTEHTNETYHFTTATVPCGTGGGSSATGGIVWGVLGLIGILGLIGYLGTKKRKW